MREVCEVGGKRPVIWLVNHYGGLPGTVRSERSWRIAESLSSHGFRCILIVASYHHIRGEELLEEQVEQLLSDGAGYEMYAIKTPRYQGNGLGRLKNMLSFYRGLKRVLRDGVLEKPELVIASSPHPFTFLFAKYAKRKAGSVAVLEERDIWPQSLVELADASPWNPAVILFDRLARAGYRSCDALVSLLPDSERFLRSRGLRSKFTCIPNGVGESNQQSKIEELPDDISRWFSRAEEVGAMTVVYAGAMGPPNALEQLIKLSTTSPNAEKPYRILCFGEGVSRKELTQAAQERASEFLTFHGPVSKPVARAVIQRAQVCYISLRPSPIFELGVSPNKLYEYMAAAKPVVYSVNSSNSPIADSEGGVSVTPYDPEELDSALCKLARMTEQERGEMGARGRDYVLKYHHWDRLGEDYARLCSRLLNVS